MYVQHFLSNTVNQFNFILFSYNVDSARRPLCIVGHGDLLWRELSTEPQLKVHTLGCTQAYWGENNSLYSVVVVLTSLFLKDDRMLYYTVTSAVCPLKASFTIMRSR